MSTSLFTIEGEGYRPTEVSRGPWSPDSLHGGPVAALLAHELSSVPTVGPMFPARFTLELWRPVLFQSYRVHTTVRRPGRRVQVLDALLLPHDADPSDSRAVVARATLQQINQAAVDLPDDLDDINGPDTVPPGPDSDDVGADTGRFGRAEEPVAFHNSATEHRATSPFFAERGPATDWIRVMADLVPSLPLSPFERVVAAADFGNGISGVLPFDGHVFINPDLTVYLYRLPVDEWVCLDAVTRIGTATGAGSVGLAESALFDRQGRIGRSLQSLLVDQVG